MVNEFSSAIPTGAAADLTGMGQRVIGIGSSAGGLEALRELLQNLPDDHGLQIVVVQHLSPTHRSMLVTLLARESRLPVVEIVDGMRLRPNTIHITPPAAHVQLHNQLLRLTPAHKVGTPKPSVDNFFQSLAEECGKAAVGVILSGTGHDGQSGIRQIHAAGGTTIVQDPQTARYDGMPLAALETGCVHHVLPPALIGRDIAHLVPSPSLPQAPVDLQVAPLDRISAIMRRATGVEIQLYKENTLQRRLKRRVQATGCPDTTAYAIHLQRHPEEVAKLMRELLISVTEFFRDVAPFRALETALHTLIADKADLDELRVWVAGCATGEEAYSIAILIAEIQRRLGRPLMVRLFATDLDEAAVDQARRGRFSHEALAGLPPELLERYFTAEKDEYLAVKVLRDSLIFSVHNLIGDPVFSRLDLISCRNVLIYFRPELQAHLLDLFHHALVPGGLLFLGKSESTQHNSRLFLALDDTSRLFRRSAEGSAPVSVRRSALTLSARPAARSAPRDRVTIFERLFRAMPGTLLPPSVLVDANLEIRHVFGDVSPWVRLGEGEVSTDLYRLAIRPLRVEVRSLVMKAQRDPKVFLEHTVQAKDLDRPARISVLRLEEADGQSMMLLVSFRPARERVGPRISQSERTTDHQLEVTDLEQQLSSTREHLHTVIEELETSNEELQSLNEEMQSSNEELTSSNEELETANEELQSTNEELTTVNEELENKGQQLAVLNDDLMNVKNSLPHPVLVIDERSHLVLFNERARLAFQLPLDAIGESLFAVPGLQDILGDLNELTSDIRSVLEHGETIERQLEGNRIGLLTISAYRTGSGLTTGVIMMFMDNTVLRAVERNLVSTHERLAEAEKFARQTIDALPQAVCVIDADGRIVSINRQWQTVMEEADGDDLHCGVGADYIGVCARAAETGDEEAIRLLHGIRAVIGGNLDHFSQEYSALMPEGLTFFMVTIRPFSPLGARHWLVVHQDITARKAQERANLLQSLALEAEAGGVFIADAGLPQAPIVYVNRAFETITGMPRADLIGRDCCTVFPGQEKELRHALARGVGFVATVSFVHGRSVRHAELSVRPIDGRPGVPLHVSGVAHDVTERVRAAETLRDTIERENLALSFAEIGSLEWTVRRGMVKCSALQSQLLGLEKRERSLSHEEFRRRLHPDDLPTFNDTLRICLLGHSDFSIDLRIVWDDGTLHWLRCRGNATLNSQQVPISVLCLTQDITSAKESELRARFLANHDALTGLANRSLLEDRLQQAINVARRDKRRIGVVFIDLDRFKEINDELGHHAGDTLLVQVARRLTDSVRQSDSVCRHSGDEFIVLLPGIHNADEAGRIVGKISQALARPHAIAGREFHVTASIGIAVYPDDGETGDMLIRNADAAMYQAKGSGRGTFDFFSPAMNLQLLQRVETASQLRRCIIDGQLELYYQPQVDVRRGQLVGLEALVRWRHPERGLLLPDKFIPHAEDGDLIHEIGQWVLEEACRQNQLWQALGLPTVPVAVNVSPVQFRKPDFMDGLVAALHKSGLAPHFLELEITERVLMNHSEAATRILGDCQTMGIRFSIDDFGTGYSSLTYLQRFPVERIKIDRSFVAVATEERTAAAIVRAVIQLGHGLGQQIVAEGVETLAQLELLRNEGCDAFQGYLCAPPLTAQECEAFLRQARAGHA